jgi:hypothetical protein
MMLLLFAQLLPHQLFAAIGSSFLDETRLSNRFLSAGKMPVGHTARMLPSSEVPALFQVPQ